jgi:hypothetical protein
MSRLAVVEVIADRAIAGPIDNEFDPTPDRGFCGTGMVGIHRKPLPAPFEYTEADGMDAIGCRPAPTAKFHDGLGWIESEPAPGLRWWRPSKAEYIRSFARSGRLPAFVWHRRAMSDEAVLRYTTKQGDRDQFPRTVKRAQYRYLVHDLASAYDVGLIARIVHYGESHWSRRQKWQSKMRREAHEQTQRVRSRARTDPIR